MVSLVHFATISFNSGEKYLIFFAFSPSAEVNLDADKEIML